MLLLLCRMVLRYAACVASIFPLLLSSCGINYSNFYEGIHDFRTHEYRDAFIRLKPAADKGQPDAQYAIGYMYYYGQGVVEDREKAWDWIRKAAHSGQPDAMKAVRILHGNLSYTQP